MNDPEGDPQRLPKYDVAPDTDIPDWIVNEAHLIHEALGKEVVTKHQAQHDLKKEDEILDVMRGLVSVKYFVEYPPEKVDKQDRGQRLLELFQQETTENGVTKPLAEYMAERGQSVSLAMVTLDDSTAEAVRYLNQKKVPVVGWIVLDDKDGYWTNRTNMRETVERTQAVKKWALTHKIELIALGFDIEKPLSYLKAVNEVLGGPNKGNIRRLFKGWRDYRAKKYARAQEDGDPEQLYQALLDSVKKEGYETEMYAMPKGSKQLFGDMDIRGVDRYVEMIYSSVLPNFLRNKGRAMRLLRSKGAIPALGLVTGKEGETPGRDLTDQLPLHLTESELETDLRAVLDQEIDLKGRTFQLRDLYLFALNDARVALMMNEALKKAFDSHLPADEQLPADAQPPR